MTGGVLLTCLVASSLLHAAQPLSSFPNQCINESEAKRLSQFYINGEWVKPLSPEFRTFPLTNPANEEEIGKLSMADLEDVNRAVDAARAAFPSYSRTSKEERNRLLDRLLEIYMERYEEMAQVNLAP